jgi:tetratricopeptide (TPR) repeat protein
VAETEGSGGEGGEVTVEQMLQAGYEARRESRSSDARALFSVAYERALSDGDLSLQVNALSGWANSESDLGRLDEACGRYAEAIALLRHMDDPLRLAHTVRHLADVARKQGRVEVARPCYEEALTIYRSHAGTVPLDLANSLRGYGLLLEALGERGAAYDVWLEALKLYTSVGVQAGIDEANRRVAAAD